jgi:nitrogen fixation/metabolism regulation signal transduction histidine kinase
MSEDADPKPSEPAAPSDPPPERERASEPEKTRPSLPTGPKPDNLRFGRFERRVLAAMTVVAFLPAIAALLLGRTALREVYQLGVNGRVLHTLESSLEVHRQHLENLRAGTQRTATMVAHDGALRDALRSPDRAAATLTVLVADLGDVPDVAAIVVHTAAGEEVARTAPAEDDPAFLSRDEERAIVVDGAPYVVTVTVRTPRAPFDAYQTAGETIEDYRYLEAEADSLQSLYLFMYIALLLAAIVVALAVGIVAARRVTRRVVVLAEATRKVGRGDLNIEIPTDEADEVAELVDAFNTMVRDIKSSRDRIEYLQRIGAWQEVARRLAHEIKNPLTPIQLAVQELHRKYDGKDPKFAKTLDDAKGIVEEEVETLRRLVSEFSGFARLPVPDVAPGELGALAKEWARNMDAAGMVLEGQSADDVSIEVRGDDVLPVMVDAQMLRRCVDNLVRNAVQAIAEHGGAGHVVIETREDDDDAILEVRDDGPGVPEKMRERVFDPYYTTKSEGTGLGLAIVKKIVLEHGGSIACVPAPEGGAAFRIRLPLKRERPIDRTRR